MERSSQISTLFKVYNIYNNPVNNRFYLMSSDEILIMLMKLQNSKTSMYVSVANPGFPVGEGVDSLEGHVDPLGGAWTPCAVTFL